jgi:hypothetical protein
MGFVVDKAALGQVFSQYCGFPCHPFRRMPHAYRHPSCAVGTVSQIAADVPNGLSLSPPRKEKKEIKSLGIINSHKKIEPIPVTGRASLQGCEMSRIPHCLDSRLIDGGKVVSFMHRRRYIPKKRYFSASGTHFC